MSFEEASKISAVEFRLLQNSFASLIAANFTLAPKGVYPHSDLAIKYSPLPTDTGPVELGMLGTAPQLLKRNTLPIIVKINLMRGE